MSNLLSESPLETSPDYETLIEQAPQALQRYIEALERENARLRQEISDLRSTSRQARLADARVTSPVDVLDARGDTVTAITLAAAPGAGQ